MSSSPVFTPAMAIAMVVLLLAQLFSPTVGLNLPATHYEGTMALSIGGDKTTISAQAELAPTGVSFQASTDANGETDGFSITSDGVVVTVSGGLGEESFTQSALFGVLLTSGGLPAPDKIAAYLRGDFLADITSLWPTLVPLLLSDVVRMDATLGEPLPDGAPTTDVTIAGDVFAAVAALRANLLAMTAHPALIRGVQELKVWDVFGVPKAQVPTLVRQALSSVARQMTPSALSLPFKLVLNMTGDKGLNAVSFTSASVNEGVSVNVSVGWSRAAGFALDGQATNADGGLVADADVSWSREAGFQADVCVANVIGDSYAAKDFRVEARARRSENRLPFHLTCGPSSAPGVFEESLTVSGEMTRKADGAFEKLTARMTTAGIRTGAPNVAFALTPSQMTFTYILDGYVSAGAPQSVAGTLLFDAAPWTTASNAYEGMLTTYSRNFETTSVYALSGAYAFTDDGRLTHHANAEYQQGDQTLGSWNFSQQLALTPGTDDAPGTARLTHDVTLTGTGASPLDIAWHSTHALSPATAKVE